MRFLGRFFCLCCLTSWALPILASAPYELQISVVNESKYHADCKLRDRAGHHTKVDGPSRRTVPAHHGFAFWDYQGATFHIPWSSIPQNSVGEVYRNSGVLDCHLEGRYHGAVFNYAVNLRNVHHRGNWAHFNGHHDTVDIVPVDLSLAPENKYGEIVSQQYYSDLKNLLIDDNGVNHHIWKIQVKIKSDSFF